ncbi:hypothetical protein [Hirschia litorea]|uniref:SMODS-associating 2TM beta-strand rich effector domain-containing protein n=1 Tax=Hirschia litorea TaxID=1199156 RepID=A0ABW2IJT8_9PROT
MNPYGRFLVVANAVSAAIVLTLVSMVSGPLFETYKSIDFQFEYAPFAAAAAALMVTIVVWLALNDAVLPFFFRYTPIRRLILGKHYMEGTWIQAEKHVGSPRMAVIEIQPAGTKFRFSGYAVDENLEVQSNVVMEFSKFDWPFMTYKFRNTLADNSDEGREGVGEIHFEANRHAPRSYNGFVQTVNSLGRVKIEGVRLMKEREIRNLRSLEFRADIIDKYWGLFFERGDRKARMKGKATGSFNTSNTTAATPANHAVTEPTTEYKQTPTMTAPLQEQAAPTAQTVERRVKDVAPAEAGPVVPRRRATDWAKSDDSLEFTDLDDFLEDPIEVPAMQSVSTSLEMSGKSILKK